VPAPGAKLPTTPLSFDPSTLQTDGLSNNMCILKGFPPTLAKSATAFPFGICNITGRVNRDGTEAFHTVIAPRYAQVVRGVAMTPGPTDGHGDAVVRAAHRVHRKS
jgi:hypothetical protein